MSSFHHMIQNVAVSMVALILLLIPAVSAEVAEIDGDQLLNPDRVVEIRIKMSPEDWSELSQQSRNPMTAFNGLPNESPYTWFKADFWIDDVEIKSVGVRKKGFLGSADAQRPSLKIKFDKFEAQDPVTNLNGLTLNNNKQDRSQVSQFLTYQLFRDAGNHASRTNWAHVTVNGEDLGVYTNVESIKKSFLKRGFDNGSGNLYEGTLTDFYPKALANIEVKNNEAKNDLGDVKRLADVLAKENELDLKELGEIINLDSFFRHWALEGLLVFWDGYSANQNNFFVYFNPNDNGRGHFIPWGADGSFSNGGPFNFGNSGTTAIYAQSFLANRLYKTKGVPERYRATMTRLLNEVWDEEKLLAEIDRVEKLVTPYLHSSQSDAAQAMNDVREFIRNRREVLEASLSDWQPDVPAEPRKPSYVVDIGASVGSFSATFSNGKSENADGGKADITMQLDGQSIEFERVTVQAQEFQFPSFGGFGGPPGRGPRGPGRRGPRGQESAPAPPPAPINIVFTGTRSTGEPITMSLIVDRKNFGQVSQEPIRVTGSFNEGGSGGPGGGFGFGGFGGGGPSRSVIGELHLKKSGTKLNDEIIGNFDFRIVETHGGFFQPRRPPSRAQAMTLQSAFDVDKDGKISTDEMEQAATVLKGLDRDNNGNLSGDELQNPPDTRAAKPPNRTDRPQIEPTDQTRSPSTPHASGNDARLNSTQPKAVVITTAEDHQNMMDQLGITKLRPGPSGNPNTPNHANVDETWANPYLNLPELLTLNSGEKVTTADQWIQQRRPEIVEEWEREVLGRVPLDVPNVSWNVKEIRDSKAGEFETVEQHIIGTADNSAFPEINVEISMSLRLPKDMKGPVPVLMMFGSTR